MMPYQNAAGLRFAVPAHLILKLKCWCFLKNDTNCFKGITSLELILVIFENAACALSAAEQPAAQPMPPTLIAGGHHSPDPQVLEL
jgi:hypothetical protein